MSKKRVTYTADFKAKVIIELLEGDMTIVGNFLGQYLVRK
ncbi:hypothetical protein fh0823_03700 [Francisella halioticida]|nr:hypothetical protein fh0823_01020 [Francisella halioticida]BCD90231.1 hypothetical protein fh0823_03700 [Francisella halioticida]